MPGPAIRFRLCGQAPLSRLQTSRRSAKYWAGVAGWPTLIAAAGPSGPQQLEQPVLEGEQVVGSRGIFSGPRRIVEPGPAGSGVPAGVLRPEGRPALGGVQAAVAGARDEQAGAPGPADRAGCRQEGHRCSSSRRCAGQANTTGSRHAFCQAPPCCCWMLLPSPARHCGQYRVAEVNTHGLASARGPHWSAVACGSAHGYRPDMLLMHSCEASVAVSLVIRQKAPARASSRCIIRLRRAGCGRRRRGR